MIPFNKHKKTILLYIHIIIIPQKTYDRKSGIDFFYFIKHSNHSTNPDQNTAKNQQKNPLYYKQKAIGIYFPIAFTITKLQNYFIFFRQKS